MVSANPARPSLLPAPMHIKVARHCIDHGKHLVTASYVLPPSPSLCLFQDSAIEKDVLILGECGLDPGIDTM
jgi:alpha-aminoadipic semialdehyde synthase